MLSVPSEDAARIAINTQNILREEAHLTDVIDPLGGSYYVETLTNEMEEKIRSVMEKIEDCGGMYQAVQDGVVQTMIGESALAFQQGLDSGEQTLVGVNSYRYDAEEEPQCILERPDLARIEAQLEVLERYRRDRDQGAADAALDLLARAANSVDDNVYARVVDAALAGVTHGEIVACLRREFGDGTPLILA